MSDSESGGDIQTPGYGNDTASQTDISGDGTQAGDVGGTDAGMSGQTGAQAGSGGMVGDLLGRAEGMLKGSSDPRAQQASDLIDKAEGLLGGQGGN